MQVRIRQRDIAEAAGVDVSTVSLALNGHPRIPLVTRERIQALADKLGYRPDPALSGLAANRFRGRSNRKGLLLGYLRTEEGGHADEETLYRNGMERQCRQLGYGLKQLNWTPDDDANELWRRARSRGYRGLLLAQSRQLLPDAFLDEPLLPVVRCGFLRRDVGDTVRPDLIAAVNICAQEMMQRFRRVAFFLVLHDDLDSDQQILAAALALQYRHGPKRLLVAAMQKGGQSAGVALVKKHAPDAIICIDRWTNEVLDRQAAPIRNLPRACIHNLPPFAGKMGMDLRLESIGQAAVNLLELKMRLPPLTEQGTRQVLSIEPRWLSG